jgi:hypothetical protein
MSVLTDYFAAGSDSVAATAADYLDGQPSLLDLTPEDVAASNEVSADPRQAALIGPTRHEEIDGRTVLSVTDTLRDALASLDASALREVARQWAIAEFAGTAEDSLVLFLTAVRDLARRAVCDSERLFCCVTF